jgi:hypothetical protein
VKKGDGVLQILDHLLYAREADIECYLSRLAGQSDVFDRFVTSRESHTLSTRLRNRVHIQAISEITGSY